MYGVGQVFCLVQHICFRLTGNLAQSSSYRRKESPTSISHLPNGPAFSPLGPGQPFLPGFLQANHSSWRPGPPHQAGGAGVEASYLFVARCATYMVGVPMGDGAYPVGWGTLRPSGSPNEYFVVLTYIPAAGSQHPQHAV